ncbi:MAG: YceI family protein [Polyangiaceae bacterium]|nr:YceI family protein [Polyangiaceae bacterium]
MNRFLYAGLIASTLTVAVSAHARLATQGQSSVEFKAAGPAGLSIVGTSSEVRASETADSVVIVVPLAKLDTGIELRNKHMRDKYLETGKYPNAELVVAKSAIKYPDVGSGEAAGQLKLHGQTKSIRVKYEAKKSGGGFAVAGSFRINIKDFGIEQPSYMGLSVKPEVDVAVKFNALDQ